MGAITRKPTADESTVQALIDKGGSSPVSEEVAVYNVHLRIPDVMLRRVDATVRARMVRVPRHTWILEAIAEKLVREGMH